MFHRQVWVRYETLRPLDHQGVLVSFNPTISASNIQVQYRLSLGQLSGRGSFQARFYQNFIITIRGDRSTSAYFRSHSLLILLSSSHTFPALVSKTIPDIIWKVMISSILVLMLGVRMVSLTFVIGLIVFEVLDCLRTRKCHPFNMSRSSPETCRRYESQF